MMTEQRGLKADLDILFCLVRSESTTVTQQINEADRDTSADVQDQLREHRRQWDEGNKSEHHLQYQIGRAHV